MLDRIACEVISVMYRQLSFYHLQISESLSFIWPITERCLLWCDKVELYVQMHSHCHVWFLFLPSWKLHRIACYLCVCNALTARWVGIEA